MGGKGGGGGRRRMSRTDDFLRQWIFGAGDGIQCSRCWPE